MPPVLKDLQLLQEKWAAKVVLSPLNKKVTLVAGVDVGYIPAKNLSVGAVILIDLKSCKVVEKHTVVLPTPFPYIPGFLSFREIPVMLEAIQKLVNKPEVIMVDGQGILHPRGIGLATHLGLTLGLPTIGIAKKPLVGDFVPPDKKAGSLSPIIFRGVISGLALRPRTGVKPIYISPGHLITLEESLEIVKTCLRGYRLPEPIRLAHLLSQQGKKLI